MESSLFPNGVLVDRTALRRTETSKAEQILKMRTDVTSRGVLSGGEVTVGVLNTDRIDIQAFAGYVPRGDFVSETLSNLNVPLSDYTLATVNVVCAVYTETNTHNQPHETDGTTYPTEAQASYRIRIFSQADFDNPAVLPATDDNLQNDAVDRCLILAKVTAEGVGVTLTTISLPTSYTNIMWTSPQQLVYITGVTILEVDPDTPVGTGTITFDDTAAPPYSFQYTSPGGVISAASTTSADAILTITDGSGYWIKIQVLVTQLPTGLVVPYAETFTISNLYYQEISRLSAEDNLHRNQTGTGIPSPSNPHAQALDDFAGQTLSLLDEHQDIMHCNGIYKGSSTNIFLGSINTLTVGGDTLTVIAPSTTDAYYINGEKLQNLAPTSVIFDSANFLSGYLGATVKEGAKYYEMYVDDNEVLIPHLRAAYPAPTRQAKGTWIVDMSQDHPAGTFDLIMYIDVAANYVNLSWGDVNGYTEGAPTPTATSVFGQVVRLYHPNNVDWIDLYIGDDSGAGDNYLPVLTGTYTDPIIVYAALDRTQNMQVMGFPYWYNTLGPRGAIGSPPYGATRVLTDNRPWGTLCVDNMADAALDHMTYQPTGEYHRSGLLNRSHLGYRTEGGSPVEVFDWDYVALSGLIGRLSGGVCYIRGKRMEVDGIDYTFTNNQTTLVWVDYLGVLHYDDFSATPYSSSLDVAVEWIIGYPQDRDVEKTPNYIAYAEITPQRGVPICLMTTLAGSITSYEFVGRYVGTPADDWTVGRKDDGAQFASLKVAFSYADLERRFAHGSTGNIKLKIKGESTIEETITQPTHVNVEGSISGGNKITVSPSVGDALGSWRLSEGNIVRDVYVECSNGVVFGLADHVALSHLKFESLGGWFVSLDTGADDVIIEGCDLVSDYGIFFTLVSGNFPRFRFLNNKVRANNYQNSYVLCYLNNCNRSVISGNYFYKDNTNLSAVLQVVNSDDVTITDNTVRIGQGAGASVEKGIYVNDCSSVYISGNKVAAVSGSTSTAGLGIQVDSSINTIIDNNIVSSMGVGILAGPYGAETGFFENVTISNNLVSAGYTTAISVNANLGGSVATTIQGLKIEGNQIHNFVKPVGADPVFGINLGGIVTTVANSSLLYIRDIIICNNTIDTAINLNASGDTYGALVDLSASVTASGLIDSVEVCDNSISRILATSSNAVWGIQGEISSGNFGAGDEGKIRNVLCNRNSIRLFSYFTSGTGSTMYGIQWSTLESGGDNKLTSKCQIDNNNIVILSASGLGTEVGEGIQIDNGTASPWTGTSIQGNNLHIPWYGIEASLTQANVSNNTIYTGSVGLYFPNLIEANVSDNVITVHNDNNNRDYAIDGANYGKFGILVNSGSYGYSVKGNMVRVYGNSLGTGALKQQSASYVLVLPTRASIEDNYSNHFYDSVSGGGTCYHLYMIQPFGSVECKGNVIMNDGTTTMGAPVASSSHGLYFEFLIAASSSMRLGIKDNTVYGCNEDSAGAPAAWEFYIDASWGSIGTNGVIAIMNNYFSLNNPTPAPNDIVAATLGSGGRFNGANLLDSWSGVPNYVGLLV